MLAEFTRDLRRMRINYRELVAPVGRTFKPLEHEDTSRSLRDAAITVKQSKLQFRCGEFGFLTSNQARLLANALIEAADLLDTSRTAGGGAA